MKQNWLQSLGAKIGAWVLLLLMSATAAASLYGVFFLTDYSAYSQSLEEMQADVLVRMAQDDAYRAFDLYEQDRIQTLNDHSKESNFRCKITKVGKGVVYSNLPDSISASTSDQYYPNLFEIENSVGTPYIVDAYLQDGLPTADKYQAQMMRCAQLYKLRVALPLISLAAILIGLTCYGVLLTAAGHRKGREELALSPIGKLPLELPFAVTVSLLFSLLFLVMDASYSFYSGYSNRVSLLLGIIAITLGTMVFTLFSMHLAVRIKLGGFWKNTLLYRLGHFLLAPPFRHLGAGCRRVGRISGEILSKTPLLWKSILFYLVLAFGSLLMAASWESGGIVLWLLGLLVVLLIPFCALMLRQLQAGIRALAQGDLSYQMPTRDLFGDFKGAAEDINRIAAGMSQAVEERLKSERMKTELLTNVSHDIKTPLTSIINYADLIAKEPCENETITQYSEVLLRQSERLRKLIDDLMDASKASSGSLEVHLSPCELNVLLAQTMGEYEQKLQERDLLLVVKQPEHPVVITADGRLLWRVFDNLMSNVYKYALSGTRVYLTLEDAPQEVTLSFKNTSAQALDLSSEELLERFVRGDLSRHSEGNGLGLSIARSLVDLQGGRLSLVTDGDLFKVLLHLPKSCPPSSL